MQNASISPDKGESLINERFPSVVDTDDLIFELGKMTVKVLNLEKLLNKLLTKTQAMQTVVKPTRPTEEVDKLNIHLKHQNEKLGAEVIRLRAKIKALKTT